MPCTCTHKSLELPLWNALNVIRAPNVTPREVGWVLYHIGFIVHVAVEQAIVYPFYQHCATTDLLPGTALLFLFLVKQ